MKTLTMTVLGLICLTGFGCFSRAHMGESYGRAYKQAFARQAVNPGASNAKTPKGLDALESAIVVETYRNQLSPKSSGNTDQMILLSPQAGSLGYAAPSAPPPPR